MLYEEGILSVVLRTVFSCGRDKYGAVEKTLKGIFTICTLLGFPVVVALWWTHLHWRQTLSLRRKCCSRHTFSQRHLRLHSQ